MSQNTASVLAAASHPLVAALYRTVLEMHGFVVLSARDGFEAVDIALRDRPALIVLSDDLAESDVAAVCTVLRARTATIAIPIVVVTRDGSGGHREALIEAGADQVLVEPCATELLAVEAKRLARPCDRPIDPHPLRRAADARLVRPS